MLSWAPPTGGSVPLAGLAALQPAGVTKRRAASDAEFAAETLGSRGGKPCGPGFSTGVLISPRTVLTAGHCWVVNLRCSCSPSCCCAPGRGSRGDHPPEIQARFIEHHLDRPAGPACARHTGAHRQSRRVMGSDSPHRERMIMGRGSMVSGGEKPDVLRRANILFTEIDHRHRIGHWRNGRPLRRQGRSDAFAGTTTRSRWAVHHRWQPVCVGGGSAAYTNVSP